MQQPWPIEPLMRINWAWARHSLPINLPLRLGYVARFATASWFPLRPKVGDERNWGQCEQRIRGQGDTIWTRH